MSDSQLNYTAMKYAQAAFDDAINKAQAYLKQCAELCHQDTKISESAREYFARQSNEAEDAIRQLKALRP